MSVEMALSYEGDLRCSLLHNPSNSKISTDAPLDNGGRGAAFSPTDLVGAALLSCAVTTMAIVGAKEGIVLSAASGRVVKEMTVAPRKIASLTLEIALPDSLDEHSRRRLEEIARGCPVARSLSVEVFTEMRFTYGAAT
jgi:putative redox protein